MSEIYRVAIHHANDNGYIEYDPATKTIKVILADDGKRRQVEAFLSTKHVIRMAQKTLRDFKDAVAVPTESVEQLKLALTRLWEHTGVYVDWSRPLA
ncbi:hypothetical protein [Sporolituus thermophilus]|uniref:Uncharacterized protein n=1 Tax=Sporolituus thermophilus DSM 23256 TaxID=1123285 RepID=A0A1G7MTD9_9FIRM|nr:hypothetical protein [Sporolituus thermophilus]SDF64320.1 hypothetical protein SAMN05660235_02265 [Sporolituus thermophilus DSM 23256]